MAGYVATARITGGGVRLGGTAWRSLGADGRAAAAAPADLAGSDVTPSPHDARRTHLARIWRQTTFYLFSEQGWR